MGNNDLTPKDILDIFKENSLFSVEKTPIGECIKMSALDAFVFGDITGSAYLDNPVFPYTTKGLLKIYYHRNFIAQAIGDDLRIIKILGFDRVDG